MMRLAAVVCLLAGTWLATSTAQAQRLRAAHVLPQIARALASPQTACQAAIAAAETAHGIPTGFLLAIGRVESGRLNPQNGSVQPWPWTIDIDAKGTFFDSRSDAVAFVETAQQAGIQSIDVGCMQVNLLQHPDAFATLDDAFDPVINANYAARFLVDLEHEAGDWVTAAGLYHSRTEALAAPYRTRWRSGSVASPACPTPSPRPPRPARSTNWHKPGAPPCPSRPASPAVYTCGPSRPRQRRSCTLWQLCNYRPADAAARGTSAIICVTGTSTQLGGEAVKRSSGLPGKAGSSRWLPTMLMLAVALASCAPGSGLPPLPPASDNAYHLGPGDQVRIITFGEDTLTGEFRLSDSGNIAVPLLGSVRAAGMTPVCSPAPSRATSSSATCSRTPACRSKSWPTARSSSWARSTSPASTPSQPGMTVLTAVAVGGGFTYRAVQGYASIVREEGNHAEEGKVTRSTLVEPGDTITIFERRF